MKRVILGTGPMGMAVMEAELARGHELVLVNRSGFVREHLADQVRVLGLDIADSSALADALSGAELVYHCAGSPVETWQDTLPVLMKAVITAASTTGVPVIYLDSMLPYGDASGIPISEITPELAGFPAAELRKSLARQLMDAHFAGKLKAIIARAPDAYGPRVLKGPLGKQVFASLIKNHAALVPGRIDIPHSFSYSKDIGRNLSILGDSPEARGKVWHLPSSPAITQQQLFDILRDMLSRNIAISTFGGKSGLAALFQTVPKEWKYLMYQYEKPFVCNHTKFSTTFGERCTAHPQALWETLEWYRRHGLGD